MDNDIYTAPQSDPENKEVNNLANNTAELATRLSRLGASILDSLIMMVCILPIMFLTGGFEGISDPTQQPSLLYNVGISLIGFIAFAAINYSPLKNNGQTIGKKALAIKIVTMENELPVMKDHILKRYATYFLPGQIPVIGQIFSLVNILFIFRKDQRCIHDLAGNTKVIKSS